LAPLGKKKISATTQLFYRRKKKSLFAKELLDLRLKKNLGDNSTFLSAIAIRERTFDPSAEKKSRNFLAIHFLF